MKELKMFVLKSCPHCKRADEMIEGLCIKKPEYRTVPFVKIDEELEPEKIKGYDYYYVPTIFVGDEKMMEGVPSEKEIERAFETAYRG